VIRYYSGEKGKLVKVDGSGEIDTVTAEIVNHLENAKHG